MCHFNLQLSKNNIFLTLPIPNLMPYRKLVISFLHVFSFSHILCHVVCFHNRIPCANNLPNFVLIFLTPITHFNREKLVVMLSFVSNFITG